MQDSGGETKDVLHSGGLVDSDVGYNQILLQACQGDQLDHGTNMVPVRTEHDAGAASYKIPNHADFLIAYR